MSMDYKVCLRHLTVIMCCCLSATSMVLAAQPAHRSAHGRIGLYVSPDRIARRTDSFVLGEYVQGMPILLHVTVRLVSRDAKKRGKDAKFVVLPREWYDEVVFDVQSVETGRRLQCPVKMIHGQTVLRGTGDEIRLDRAHRQISGKWLMDGDSVSALGIGPFYIRVTYGSHKARLIKIDIKKGMDSISDSRMRIRKAALLGMQGQYAKAIAAAEEEMTKRGRDARDGEVYAILIAADGYEKTSRLKKALGCYEEYLSIFKSRELLAEPTLTLLHIHTLRKRLEEKDAGIGVIPSQ